MLCSEGVIVNHGKDQLRAITLKCRSWGCPNCHEDRQRQLVGQAHGGKPTTFITLTSNPAHGFSPAHRAKQLAKAWPIVVKRACKKYGYTSIPYICVFEATKKGEPHLHILCRVKWISQRWLSVQMQELTKSKIVDIRTVKNSKHVANYIAKYIGKEPHRFATCKRYWKTRSWELAPFEREEETPGWYEGWEVRDVSLEFLTTQWEAWGWEVTKTRHGAEGRAPPRVNGSLWASRKIVGASGDA